MLGRIIAREDWSAAALPRWPYLVVALGALGLVTAGQDDARVCTRNVFSKAQQIDTALPSDPAIIAAMFERLSRAADLCERGEAERAQRIIESLHAERPI